MKSIEITNRIETIKELQAVEFMNINKFEDAKGFEDLVDQHRAELARLESIMIGLTMEMSEEDLIEEKDMLQRRCESIAAERKGLTCQRKFDALTEQLNHFSSVAGGIIFQLSH